MYNLIVINNKSKTCRQSSIIDLTVTNSKAYNYIVNWKVSRFTQLSDHETILFDIASPNDNFEMHFIKSTWKFVENNMQPFIDSINRDHINQLFHFIDCCSSPQDIDHAVHRLTKILIEAAYSSLPIRKFNPYPKKYSWWSQDLEYQKRHFHHIKNLYYRPIPMISKDEYIIARNSYINNIRKAKRNSFHTFLEDADSKDHFGNTYKILKMLLSKSNNRIPLIDDLAPSNKQAKMCLMLDSLFPDDNISNDNPAASSIRNHQISFNNHSKTLFNMEELLFFIKNFIFILFYLFFFFFFFFF